MIDSKKVLEINKYVIENNATIEMVCQKFSMSRRTAQAYTGKYLKELKEQSNNPDIKELYDKVQEVKKISEKANRFEKLNISLDEVIEYIIETKTTIEYASLKYGVSESTIKKYISKLKEIDNDLYKKYKIANQQKQNIGYMVGGKNGKRQPTITEFEALEIAETMISNSMTLEEASSYFNMPTSTIYERIKSIDDNELQDELDDLFNNNKRRI